MTKNFILSLLILSSLLTLGCSIINQSLDNPSGKYTGTGITAKFTLTFSGDTLTIYDPLFGKQIYNYYFTNDSSPHEIGLHGMPVSYQPPPTPAVSGIDATTIWMRSVIPNSNWTSAPFQYVPEHKMIVYGGTSYYK